MASEHVHSVEHLHHAPRTLPAVLSAPEAVATWRLRAAIVAAVCLVLSLIFVFLPGQGLQVFRAYLTGSMLIFNFIGGALVLLMLQYVSGGKWGHILRRPLEAMTRTWPLLVLLFIPILVWMRKLYLWAAFSTPQATLNGYHNGLLTNEQHLDINFRHKMLAPGSAVFQFCLVMAIMILMITLLNRWSLQRDTDPRRGTLASYDYWRVKFENLSGPGILLYVVVMTDFVIIFVKSLDIIWVSSVFGLQFLVAQTYGVLALGVLTLIVLSRYEPMKTLFRMTEQHDLGKLLFAFVMFNIYLTFAEFLIIWSGNIPDELVYYLKRIDGGWWYICTLDVICHWVIPFCILLSRDIKRSKKKMVWVVSFMLLARLIDMFWLICPSFKDQASHLRLVGNLGILSYLTVPIGLVALWTVYYLTELTKRPLLALNDPHTEELLEPEHAH